MARQLHTSSSNAIGFSDRFSNRGSIPRATGSLLKRPSGSEEVQWFGCDGQRTESNPIGISSSV